MANIRPFKAIRPVRDKVHLMAAMPHYSYKRNVLRAILETNPFTFLNIIHPEFKSKVKTASNSKERFEQIRGMYADFMAKGYFIQEEDERLYVYRQTKDGHAFLGIIGGASVKEYHDDKIKKHEATLTSREAVFTNYLDIVGYNAEPVLLSYSGEAGIRNLMAEKIEERPEYEFTTTDLSKHELWVLSASETQEMVKAFEQVKAIYIADGHHRSASSAGLHEIRTKRGHKHYPNESHFLAFLVEEENLRILEFNRMVKTLNGLSAAELLEALQDSFEIKALGRSKKPSKTHEITMCLENNWYQLTCKPHIIEADHPIKSLDAEILTQFVLDPILGIKDLKADNNIDFISGNFGAGEISKRIRRGDFKIGFMLYPVSFEEVRKVADNQMTMPPKSTWVEPKLRSGLTIYHLNE